MALPTTISDIVLPVQNYFVGPFKSGNAVYIVAIDSLDSTLIEVHKATDPATSFSEVDGANRPDILNTVFSMWVFQVGTDIHVVHSTSRADPSRYGYSIFHMATDLWDGTIVNEQIDTVSGIQAETTAISVAVRSDGDVIVLYAGSIDTVHGTPRERVDYARREGGSWTVGIAVDDGGTVDWFGAVIVPGSSDRMHFFLSNRTDADAYQRTLLSDNSLETFPSAGDAAVAAQDHVFGPGISYESASIQLIRCPYVDSNGQISYAEFDSADAPGAFAVNADVSDNDVRVLSDTMLGGMAVDGLDEHLVYVDITSLDFFQDVNDGTDVLVVSGTSPTKLSCNIYERGAQTVIGLLYNEGGTELYNEVSGVAESTFDAIGLLSGVTFPDENYFIGPFSGSV